MWSWRQCFIDTQIDTHIETWKSVTYHEISHWLNSHTQSFFLAPLTLLLHDIPLPSNALFTQSIHPIRDLPLNFTPLTLDQIYLPIVPHLHSLLAQTIVILPVQLDHQTNSFTTPVLRTSPFLHLSIRVTTPMLLNKLSYNILQIL